VAIDVLAQIIGFESLEDMNGTKIDERHSSTNLMRKMHSS